MSNDKTLVWVADDDPVRAQSIASAIGEVLDTTEIDIVHSKKDMKSLAECMREVAPDLFMKSPKHTYQDLYHEQAARVDGARAYLEFAGAISGDAPKQLVVEAALTMLKTGVKTPVHIVEQSGEVIVKMIPKGKELVDAKEE